MIKKIVTLSYLSAAAPQQPPPSINYGDCADELPHDMFEEGGRPCVVVCAVRLFCVCSFVVRSFVL